MTPSLVFILLERVPVPDRRGPATRFMLLEQDAHAARRDE